MPSVLPTGDVFVAALRRRHDESVDMTGEEALLYHASAESDDLLGDDQTVTWAGSGPETVMVVVEEKPPKALLKALGLHVDEDGKLPIIARFRYADDVRPGDVVKLTRKVAVDAEDSESGTYCLEVLERLQESGHVEAVTAYKMAPWRGAAPE